MFQDEIFDGKSFSDLLKEIHTNSKKKEKQINSLIAQLHPRTEAEGSDFSLSDDEKKQLINTVKEASQKIEWEEDAKSKVK